MCSVCVCVCAMRWMCGDGEPIEIINKMLDTDTQGKTFNFAHCTGKSPANRWGRIGELGRSLAMKSGCFYFVLGYWLWPLNRKPFILVLTIIWIFAIRCQRRKLTTPIRNIRQPVSCVAKAHHIHPNEQKTVLATAEALAVPLPFFLAICWSYRPKCYCCRLQLEPSKQRHNNYNRTLGNSILCIRLVRWWPMICWLKLKR